MSRRLQHSLITAAVALALALTEVVTFYVNGWPGPLGPAVDVVSSVLVLLAYLAVGAAVSRRYPAERIGLLFTLVGYGWFLPSLTQVHSAIPFTIGVLTMSVYQAGLAQLALGWPYGRLRSGLDVVVVTGIYCWNIGSNFVQLLFWNPRTTGCGTACPANLLMIDGSARIYSSVGSVVTVVSPVTTVAVVALIAWRFWQARGYARRAMTLLVLVAAPIAAYIVALGFPDNLGLPDLLVYGFGPLILIVAPAAYVLGMVRTSSARRALGAALVDLEPGPSPGRLRDALAGALGDPGLRLAMPTSDRCGYTDTGGVPVDPARLPAGSVLTALDPASGAMLIYHEDLQHEPEVVRIAVTVANLALEHARLQVEAEAQLDQVRASRARIVEAADAGRRRLERDLHDGAQQRLVTLSLALAMARSRAAGMNPELESLIESASKEAREALVELRELARGIHPAILTETGLVGAIEALVERSPVAVTVTAMPGGRFTAAIEATVYFVVSEALANVAKHVPSGSAEVCVRRLPGQLTVRVSDDGAGGARPETGTGLRGLADRVASVNGELRVDSPPGGGTRLEAVIPCP
jgi:signal transduction histidine kinase